MSTWRLAVNGLSPGEWFPCDFPERQFDDDVAFHACCHACFVAAQAGKMRGETFIDPDNLCDPPRVCHGYKFIDSDDLCDR